MLYEIEGFIVVYIHEWILCIVLCISSDENNHFSTGVDGFLSRRDW